MKKFIYAMTFSTLLATLTSCTADEIEQNNNPIQTTTIAADSEITPPSSTPIPNKP